MFTSKMVMFHSYVAVYQRVARRNVSKLQYASLLFGFFLAKPKTTVPLQTSGKRREIG
jgi:hypothetical protein